MADTEGWERDNPGYVELLDLMEEVGERLRLRRKSPLPSPDLPRTSTNRLAVWARPLEPGRDISDAVLKGALPVGSPWQLDFASGKQLRHELDIRRAGSEAGNPQVEPPELRVEVDHVDAVVIPACRDERRIRNPKSLEIELNLVVRQEPVTSKAKPLARASRRRTHPLILAQPNLACSQFDLPSSALICRDQLGHAENRAVIADERSGQNGLSAVQIALNSSVLMPRSSRVVRALSSDENASSATTR